MSEINPQHKTKTLSGKRKGVIHIAGETRKGVLEGAAFEAGLEVRDRLAGTMAQVRGRLEPGARTSQRCPVPFPGPRMLSCPESTSGGGAAQARQQDTVAFPGRRTGAGSCSRTADRYVILRLLLNL